MKEVNAEQIENVLAMFSEMGINIVEEAETEEGSEGAREALEEEESSSRSRAPRRARPNRVHHAGRDQEVRTPAEPGDLPDGLALLSQNAAGDRS